MAIGRKHFCFLRTTFVRGIHCYDSICPITLLHIYTYIIYYKQVYICMFIWTYQIGRLIRLMVHVRQRLRICIFRRVLSLLFNNIGNKKIFAHPNSRHVRKILIEPFSSLAVRNVAFCCCLLRRMRSSLSM